MATVIFQKRIWLTLNSEIILTLTLLKYMQMQMLLHKAEHLHIEEQLLE